MSCEYCEFDHPEKDFEIELYEATSYKYEGKKYYLEVTYPADGKRYKNIKNVEVFFCPKCGRKLQGD